MLPHEYTGKEFYPELHHMHAHPPHHFQPNLQPNLDGGSGDDDSWIQEIFEGILSWFM